MTGGGGLDIGGILLNNGRCQIVKSTLQGGIAHEGGAIYNGSGAVLTIASTTISNSAAEIGAGISNYGTLDLTNSTISGNGSVQTARGGGLENRGSGNLVHTTFAFNRAVAGGGISSSSKLFMQNSIIGSSLGEDCAGSRFIISNGYNLDSDGSCVLAEPTDISGMNPGFGLLQNNGGTTMTHTLFPFSPGRDSGLFIEALATDQRR